MSYWLLENRREISTSSARCGATPPVGSLSRTRRCAERDRAGAPPRAPLAADRAARARKLASRIASLETLHCALDLVEVAHGRARRDRNAARAYFDLGERIGLTWIKEQIESLPAEGHWQAVARGTLRDNLYELQRKITGAAGVQGQGAGRARGSLAPRHAAQSIR
jgi:hypothetical protein